MAHSINTDGDKSYWDAHKLVREYVSIAWIVNGSIPFEELPFDRQIRVSRVASVICAYLNIQYLKADSFDVIDSVFSNCQNRNVLAMSEVCDSDFLKLTELLCQVSDDDRRTKHLLKRIDIESDRAQLLNVLLRQRIATEKLKNTFSGVLEARAGACIGIKAMQGLYYPVLHDCNKIVDDMIVILLGNIFKRTFTERELVESHNYPTVTDDELLDWKVNNFML